MYMLDSKIVLNKVFWKKVSILMLLKLMKCIFEWLLFV